MDPYEVLGIASDSDMKTIKRACKKMLLKTHPDKMGHSQFFNIVHEAYRTIKKEHSSVNYPTEKRDYEIYESNTIQRPKEQFDINNFNKMFEQYANMYNDIDPFINGGYKTCNKLNYQEEIKELQKNKIRIPKQELVIFKEPEALASQNLESLSHLGVNKITDYTCSSGVDYMRAYSEDAELIDNRQEYKNLEHIKDVRSQQSFQLTDEDRRKQRKNEKKQHKLEQMRQNQMNKNDESYSKIHSYIQNRLL